MSSFIVTKEAPARARSGAKVDAIAHTRTSLQCACSQLRFWLSGSLVRAIVLRFVVVGLLAETGGAHLLQAHVQGVTPHFSGVAAHIHLDGHHLLRRHTSCCCVHHCLACNDVYSYSLPCVGVCLGRSVVQLLTILHTASILRSSTCCLDMPCSQAC